MQLPHVLCGCHFVCSQAFLPNRTGLLASLKLLAACHPKESQWQRRSQLGSAAQESNMKDTRIMQNYFLLLDKYRSCWFVHACSGFVKSIFVCFLKMGSRTCWGAVSQHLWLGFFFFPPFVQSTFYNNLDIFKKKCLKRHEKIQKQHIE